MAALAAMILAALIAAPIASADAPNCVTRVEFSRFHKVTRSPGRPHLRQARKAGQHLRVRRGQIADPPVPDLPNDSLVQVSFSKTPGTRYRMDGKYSIWG